MKERRHRLAVMQVPLVRGLTAAEFFSSIGSTMAVIAIAYLSYTDSKSVVHTVIVSAAYSLPTALFGLLASRVAARMGHRRLLVLCNVLKLVLYSGLTVLAAAGELHVPELIVSSLVAGTISAFNSPAWMELERDVIPPECMADANAVFTAAASAAGVLGAFLGGVLLGAVGAWALFLVDATSYIGFLVVLSRARPHEVVAATTKRTHLRDAVAYIWQQESLRHTFLRTALLSLLIAPISQLLPAIADDLSNTSSSLGVLTGAFAVGAIALAYVIARLQARYTRFAILNITFLIAGAVLVLFGRSGDALKGQALWVVVLASLVPLGLLLALAQSVLSAIVELRVDTEMEGAVFALYAIVYTVLAPLGGIALGQFADQNDVWDALTLSGSIVVAGAVIALLFWKRPVEAPANANATAPLQWREAHVPLDALLRNHVQHLHRRRIEPKGASADPDAQPSM